ncbi:hypothetical protein IM793_12555 [Pedobacter sp. MR2016-19]|uniref:hypothetical protein n=1 Tax=Pedobacter sp. MR2016-19 TaxID=2780089 RepID=UPI001874CF64|nr:hypothetical protein [Pedobacter sp. MR2016-19]MBE5319995.1 hypothetical protein [Pedobacter sp. MR2016-19]
MKITTKILFFLMLTAIFSAKAQQIKFPENFKLNLSVIPGYRIIKDAGTTKGQNTENVKQTDSLYIQRFESAGKRNTIEVYVYQLKSEEMFSEKEFIERLQLTQGYLQMLGTGAFEFLKVKNYLIQVQSINPKATNKSAGKIELDKLANYYKKKLGAVTFKIPAIQNANKISESTNSATKSPDYKSLRRWVANNFGPDFYKQYIHEGSGRITLILNFDEQGKTTVKEIKGTGNEKLIRAIKERIEKMPLWTKDQATYSSTLSLPLEFRDVEQ